MSEPRLTKADMEEAARLKARGAELTQKYHDQCRADLVRRVEAAIVEWQGE
jgi:hypothetical protein